MKTIALFNPKSGSVPADARDRLSDLCQEAGIAGVEPIETDAADCEGQLRRLAGQSPDLFIVWGGDGTIRSALSIVGPVTPNLVLLPGGTMNLLPRSIHGEKSWDTILRGVLNSPKQIALSAGDVNGERFYCAMLAGAPAQFAEVRENLRRGDLMKAAAATSSAMESLRTMHLEASYRDGYTFTDRRLPTSSMVGAIIGSLTKAGHGMEVASLANPTATSALNVVWTSLFSDWRNATGVEVAPSTSLHIGSEDGREIPIIADGEAIESAATVSVLFVEKASRCLAVAE